MMKFKNFALSPLFFVAFVNLAPAQASEGGASNKHERSVKTICGFLLMGKFRLAAAEVSNLYRAYQADVPASPLRYPPKRELKNLPELTDEIQLDGGRLTSSQPPSDQASGEHHNDQILRYSSAVLVRRTVNPVRDRYIQVEKDSKQDGGYAFSISGFWRDFKSGDTTPIEKLGTVKFSSRPSSIEVYVFKNRFYLITTSPHKRLKLASQSASMEDNVLTVNVSMNRGKKKPVAQDDFGQIISSFVQVWEITELNGRGVIEQVRYRIADDVDYALGRFVTSAKRGYLVAFSQAGKRIYFLSASDQNNNEGQGFALNHNERTKIELKDGTPVVLMKTIFEGMPYTYLTEFESVWPPWTLTGGQNLAIRLAGGFTEVGAPLFIPERVFDPTDTSHGSGKEQF